VLNTTRRGPPPYSFTPDAAVDFFFDSRMEIYGTSRGNAAGVVTSVAFFINEIEQACRGPCITQRTVMILQANAVDFAESTKAV
jgi:hypothetical protein